VPVESSRTPSPATTPNVVTPVTTPVVPTTTVTTAAATTPATKFKIVLRVGEGEPLFEVRHGDDLVMKVLCEKVDIKSPEKGQGLSAVTATGKVRFVGFGAEGTCESLSFLAGTGEVLMTGNVKVQVKDKIGRVGTHHRQDAVSARHLRHARHAEAVRTEPLARHYRPKPPTFRGWAVSFGWSRVRQNAGAQSDNDQEPGVWGLAPVLPNAAGVEIPAWFQLLMLRVTTRRQRAGSGSDGLSDDKCLSSPCFRIGGLADEVVRRSRFRLVNVTQS
jgi:hypothetical protein